MMQLDSDVTISSEITERVVQIPELYEGGTKSTATLLKEAGALEQESVLDTGKVEEVFRRKPALIELWLKRGKDQRLAGGWGIEREDGEYRFQSYADGHSLFTADPVRAAAELVVCYVGFVGEASKRKQ
jgi:hypothetical protein